MIFKHFVKVLVNYAILCLNEETYSMKMIVSIRKYILF